MRRIVFLAVLILSSAFGPRAQAQNTISTVAGGGTNATTASSVYLPAPYGIAKDNLGNTYLSVPFLYTVYKVTSAGTVSVYAGTGTLGFSGDNGPATSAQLGQPQGLAVDSTGNLFIAESQSNRIRKVNTSGIITTVAGSGNQYNGVGFFGGYTGDGGPATSALLNGPNGVAVDANGNLFIADTNNNVIRMVDNSPEHIITTYAGGAATVCTGATDTLGDGCPATQAMLAAPESVAIHSSGDLYIADTGFFLVRKVDNTPNHIITLYAGNINGTICATPPATDNVGDGCPATHAVLTFPEGIFVDGTENVFVGDNGDQRVRRIDHATQVITSAAGNGLLCSNPATPPVNCGDGGPATSALLNSPIGVIVDGVGNLIFADSGTDRYRMVTPGASPTISNLAGGGTGGDTLTATNGLLASPGYVISDGSGNLFTSESFGFRVRRVDAATQAITTYAGNGIQGTAGNGGAATLANLLSPTSMALDGAGNLYLRDGLVVRKVDVGTKAISVVAGNGARCNVTANPTCGDGGPATSANLARPTAIALDPQGNLYIADRRLNRIRVVCENTSCPILNPTIGNIYNFAGTGTAGFTNGPALSATLNTPFGMVFDGSSNMFFADSNNNVIRKIDNTTSHVISTYAFNGQPTFGGDGGSALSASMQFPQAVALDTGGNLFVGGGFDNIVRRIDANDQSVITVAGDIHNLDGGFSGDGGPSVNALLDNFGVSLDGSKNLYIADTGNNRMRKVHLAPAVQLTPTTLQNFGPVLQGAFGAPQIITIMNNGLDDLTITNVTASAGFGVTNECLVIGTLTPQSVPPGGSCLLIAQFGPVSSIGPIPGTISFNTNDPNNSTVSYSVSGTGVATASGVPLTVTVTGAGTVAGEFGGIACPSTCTANFAPGQQVTLVATPTLNSGSTLTAWTVNGSPTAACPATSLICIVTIGAAGATAAATFGPATVSVSGMGNGSGTITSTPAGITCTVTNGVPSGACSFNPPAGTQTVTLTACASGATGCPVVPAGTTSTFAGWLGFCGAAGINSAGTGPCALNLDLTLVPALNGTLATAVFSGPPAAFSQGQVFVGTVDGMVFVYSANGTLVQVLNSGALGGGIAGMNFDSSGNLFAANFGANTVERFVGGTATPTTFAGPYHTGPLGLVIDPNNNVFVGQSSGNNTLLEFSSSGALTNTFFPAYDQGGIGNLELLDDAARILYTSSTQNGTTAGSVRNYDIANNHQNPDFAVNLPGGPAFALRELRDKSVLVANSTQITHLDPNGNVITTPSLTPPAGGLFFALNLDPSGTSFWTGDALTGKVYQVQISNGAILNTVNTGLGFNSKNFFTTVFGIAVFGQPQSGGADLAVTVSAPTADAVNTQITYTATVTNNGPLAAAGVSVTDTFAANVTINSATSTQGTCSGSPAVTCNVGTMNSGAVVTVTFKVTPTQVMTLNNTVTANATTPDPIPGNNSFTTSTTVTATGPMPAAITMSAPSSVQLGTGLTYAIQVTNPGTTTLTSLTVADTLPGGLSATSLSSGCTGTNSITCNIATLTPGQIVEFDITIVPTALGTLTNTGATVTGGSNSGPVSTNVINNGVALVMEVDSANSADFITTNPSSGICTQAQTICTNYFPSGTMVTLTANGPGFIGWSVNNSTATCPGTGSCTVTLSSPQQVIAGYNAIGLASSQLTTGVVGFPYGSDPSKGIIGGVPPYTITLTGTLPNGLTFTAPSISGIPTTPGVTQLTVNITDSIGEKGSTPATLTIISAPSGQEALANGNYAILFHGVNDSDGSLSAVVGSLHFNGKGVIDSGTLDTNGNSTGQVPKTLSSVTGTYTIGADHRGLIKLQSAGATLVVLAMSVGDVYQGVAHTAHFVEFDDTTGTGSRGAGIARLQDPNAFTPASMAGTYIIGNTGQDTSHNRLTEVGLVSLNATATITNVTVDSNDNGVLGTLALVSGSYGTDGSNGTISPVGRTQFHQMLTKTIGGVNTPVTTNVAVYIVDANTLFKLRIDSGATNPIFAGTDERQMNPGSFSAASLSGPDVVAVQGPLNAGSQSDVLIGVGTFTPAAGANPTTGTLSFTKDENDGGNVTVEGIENDTYTAAATGRVVVTPASGNPVFLYLSRPDHGYVMGTDPSPVFGTIDLQTGGPFSDTALPANYFFGDREPASTTRGQSTSGVTTLSGNTLSTTFDSSHEGGRLDYATMGTFGLFVAPSGRMVFTHNPNNLSVISDEVGQVITPSHVVFTEIDPTQNRPVLHEAESFTMPPGVPSPNPTSVNFPTPVAIGSIALSAPITFTNVGDGLLSITGHTNATDFFASGTCLTAPPVIVISQGTCTVIITFAPVAGTPTNTLLNETVTLQTDAGNITINASGTATPQTATLVSVAVTPANPSIAKGRTQQFTATGTFSDNSTQNITNTVTWASATASIATISNAAGSQGLATSVGTGTSTISATMSGISGSTVLTVTAAVLQSIAVTPANPSIAKGKTQQFTATGTFSDNSTQNITNTVTWASATTSIATISNAAGSQGLATSVGTGASTISATMSGITGSTVLTVGPAVLASLNVTPKNQQIVVGSTLQFTATGTLTDGTIQDFTKTVTWSSLKPAVATISNTSPTQGLATAVSTVNSPTVITAVQGGIQDLTQLGVIAAPTFVLTVTEAGSGAGTVVSSPAGINCPTQCTASYASGTPVTLTATPATGSTFAGWSGACANATGTCAVTMNQAQAVTATFNGTVTTFPLTVATAGTGTGTVTGNGINCTSGSTTGCAVNLASSTAVTLTAAPATGSTFTGWSATPTSCNVAGTICAFSMPAGAEGVTATFNVATGPTLTSIAVTPLSPTIGLGQTQQFTATGTFSDNSTQNLTTSVNWTSSLPAVGTISNASGSQGLASAVALGTTTVTATMSGVTGTGILTVAPPIGFALTGNLIIKRSLPTATLLNDGTVLIAGGAGATNFTTLASAEVYSPTSGAFTATGSMNSARFQGTATLLPNGMVLVAGGRDNAGTPLATAELFNPTTGTFTLTGSMTTSRIAHSAVLLPNGTVLIAGGATIIPPSTTFTLLASAEIFNPATGTFTATGSMTFAGGSTITLLSTGKVLVAGGGGTNLGADLYDSATGTFTATGGGTNVPIGATATLLNSGMVLFTGGLSVGNATPSAELYDPTSDTFISTGSMITGRFNHTATVLNNGMVLVAAGYVGNNVGIFIAISSAELYDPASGTFAETGSLNVARDDHTATLLNNGKVLVAGGDNVDQSNNVSTGDALASSELYTPSTMTPPGLTSISVTPANPIIPVGTFQRFVATGTFSSGPAQTLASVMWSSSNTNVASITNDVGSKGFADDSPGTTTITATAGTINGSTLLTVVGPTTHFLVSAPAAATAGTSINFTVTAKDAANNTVITYGGTVNFSSTDGAAILPASDVGLTGGVGTFSATLKTVGPQTITVTDTVTASITGTSNVITVSTSAPVLVSISVAPPTASIVAGTTQAFTATGHFSDGSTGPVVVTWSSSNIAIATIIPATGLATGVTAGGPVTITATSTLTPTITGTAQLTVTAPTLISIAVTPVNPTVVVGQAQQFTATGTFSDKSTQDLTASVVWASSNTDSASITAGGLATGLTGGTSTTITGTKAVGNTNIVGTTTLIVTTVPFVLTITPPPGGNPGLPPTITPGGTLAIGLTLTATKGFNGTVTFSCVSNKPQFLTCAPAPSSVTLSGNTPKQVAIVLNTFCQGETPMYGPGPGGFGGGLALLLAAAMLGSITWAYRTRSRWALSFAVLMLIALGNAACSSLPSGPSGRTPAGTYTLNITATAGGASQTVQQQIQVLP